MIDINNKKKKVPLQELYGRPQATQTLCNETNSNTKIAINPNTAKQNLQNLKVQLSKNAKRLSTLKFLYNDICNALGINSSSPSHYGGFIIDGVECSIRVSNHNSNANTYEINLNNNISLKIRPKGNKNSFKSSENVTLEEFTYFDYMIQQDKNLVLDIIDSLIGYLTTGEYVDESGLAKKNYSPDLQTISQQRVQQTLQRKDNEDFINRWHMGENKKYNINNTMKNKKVIRLTESDLHTLIEETVSNVLILNENAVSNKNAASLLYKVYWLLNDCYFRWKYVKGLSKREEDIIEVIGNATSKIAKVVELLEPGRLPM